MSKGKHFLLENLCEGRSESVDFYFNDLNSKNLKTSIRNNSECDQKFKHGNTLGKLTLLKNDNNTTMFTQENMKFVKTSETIVREKGDHVFELSDKIKTDNKNSNNNNRLKISNDLLAKPTALTIEHCIHLKGDIPVLSSPKNVLYSFEKPVKSEIKMFENDFTKNKILSVHHQLCPF